VEFGQGVIPDPVQPRPQRRDAVGVEAVDAAVPSARLTTNPPLRSTRRCWETAGLLIGSWSANS
jgi:hypothetical protein